jgi:hypothetical protein
LGDLRKSFTALDSRGNGRHTMSNEATAMEDGGGSVTREENGNDLFIPAGEMDRWSASPTRRQGHDMARGTAALRLAGRPGSARLANGKRQPAQGGYSRPVGVRRVATMHWRTDAGARAEGTDGLRSASMSGPRGSHGGCARGVARRRRTARALERRVPEHFGLTFFD